MKCVRSGSAWLVACALTVAFLPPDLGARTGTRPGASGLPSGAGVPDTDGERPTRAAVEGRRTVDGPAGVAGKIACARSWSSATTASPATVKAKPPSSSWRPTSDHHQTTLSERRPGDDRRQHGQFYQNSSAAHGRAGLRQRRNRFSPASATTGTPWPLLSRLLELPGTSATTTPSRDVGCSRSTAIDEPGGSRWTSMQAAWLRPSRLQSPGGCLHHRRSPRGGPPTTGLQWPYGTWGASLTAGHGHLTSGGGRRDVLTGWPRRRRTYDIVAPAEGASSGTTRVRRATVDADATQLRARSTRWRRSHRPAVLTVPSRHASIRIFGMGPRRRISLFGPARRPSHTTPQSKCRGARPISTGARARTAVSKPLPVAKNEPKRDVPHCGSRVVGTGCRNSRVFS